MNVNQEAVRLSDLSVDPTVQRVEGLDHKRVNDMAKDFDPRLLGTITVSLRENGSMIVLDGWHRIEAAKIAGYEEHVFATVYEGLTVEQEREIFVGVNASKQVSAVTKFVMRVGYEEPVAVALNNVLQAHGWRVGAGSSDGVFSAVVALEQIFRNGAKMLPNGEHLDLVHRTIKTITAAWGYESAGASALMVKGIAKVYAVYGDDISQHDLIESLSRETPMIWTSRIRNTADIQKTAVDQTAAFVFVMGYNKGKRTKGIEPWRWRK